MNENDKIVIEKLEYLNNEYLSSSEYSLGIYVKYLQSLFKQKKFIQLSRMVLLHFKQKKEKEKNEDITKRDNKKYVVETNDKKKIAVYTCIVGNYDKVEEPIITESSCDYFLFTNNKEFKSDSWTIKDIPEKIKKLENNAKINRYMKMHPKELFPDYDYSIYIDGNVQIVSVISQLTKRVNNKTGLAIHRHCQRKCIYDEIKACRAYNKGKYSNLKLQAKRYKKEGLPKEFGMLECNMLISDLKNETSEKIFNSWWDEYLQSESMRDQIALPYVLWKNKFNIEDVGNLGTNINANCLLKINTHKK